MKSWDQLFIRTGWLLTKKEENVFDCKMETDLNLDFLLESLNKTGISYSYDRSILNLSTTAFSEERWVKAVDFDDRGHYGDWFQPGEEEPRLRELDTHISGLVRQVNRLGFYTSGSCDGHGKKLASLFITKGRSMRELEELLVACGIKQFRFSEGKDSYTVKFRMNCEDLLDLTEKFSLVSTDWLEKGSDFIVEQLFQCQSEELLTIPGKSGEEALVRDYVAKKITPYVDHLTVDHAGNLLAEKTYRGGNGPTILLNAHLDTVHQIKDGREIVKNKNVWSSSKGILGADDRAGVAVLLHLAEYLSSTPFSGRVKFIFTVDEERGLVGSRQVDDYFLWGTDAAIVIDRRGKGDIVTSCGGYIPFCDQLYGKFFETIATTEGLNGWKTTQGGSSDTRIWAEHGIESVNLSAGYMNEHKEEEVLDVAACYQTARLVKAVFNNCSELRRVLSEIKRNKHDERSLIKKRVG